VLLTMKEVNRLRVLQGYMDGKMFIEETARIFKRSLRSVYRMLAKVRKRGPEGVIKDWKPVSCSGPWGSCIWIEGWAVRPSLTKPYPS